MKLRIKSKQTLLQTSPVIKTTEFMLEQDDSEEFRDRRKEGKMMHQQNRIFDT